MGGAALVERPGRTAERSDHELVSAVRRGDERAFEQLYERYQRRIAAYVLRMVKDHGRAEDVTQEVFVSALRRMRATERPIAFKPWIYEIAKNACIDAYRRRRRTEEVSFDADDRLSPADQVRLVATSPEPDEAVGAKQDVGHLFGAFSEVPDNHYEILVLREFDGLSYEAIGERLGMTRPAVESALFRARRRLGEEYGELASGARCVRAQSIIADADERLGRGDRRRLARHVAHCDPCRRLAARAGLDIPAPMRRRVAEKLAGLLPLPAFLRFRHDGEEPASAPRGGGGGAWLAHLPTAVESMNSGWSKGAAALAALLVAGGVGVSTLPDRTDERGDAGRAPPARIADPAGAGGATVSRRAAPTAGERDAPSAARRGGGPDRKDGARGSGGGKGTASQPGTGGGNGAGAGDQAGTGNSPSGQELPRVAAPKLPAVNAPGVKLPDVNETADTCAGRAAGRERDGRRCPGRAAGRERDAAAARRVLASQRAERPQRAGQPQPARPPGPAGERAECPERPQRASAAGGRAGRPGGRTRPPLNERLSFVTPSGRSAAW